MWMDVRHAIRALRRAPALTMTAVCILALGIGGTTGMFGLVRAVLLAPLPYADADRIFSVSERRQTSGEANLPVSGHEYVAWRDRARTFERMALVHFEQRHLTSVGEPERVDIMRVSVDYFPLLHIRPVLGRVFVTGEDRDGGGRVAVLSDRLWRRRFAADPAIVGQTMTIDDLNISVVGVLPPLPVALAADAWLPIDLDTHSRSVGRHSLHVLGKLLPGATLEEATADLRRVAATLEQELPNQNAGHSVAVAGIRESLVGEHQATMMALLAAVALVLLIAAANVANLLLARSSARQREFAVRSALGASSLRIMRLVLAESLLVAIAAGAMGLLVALWLMDLAVGLTTIRIPLLDAAGLDAATLAVASALTLITGVAIGFAASMQSARWPTSGLNEGSRVSEDRRRGRLRAALVASEVALAFVLLIGAGLMLNSFLRLTAVEPGFTSEGTLALSIDLPGSRYPQPHQRMAFVNELVSRLETLPGVASAGATSHLPLGGADNWMAFTIGGRPEPAPGQTPTAAVRVVSPGYFRVLQVKLRAGRYFEDSDARLALPVIRWFPQQPNPPDFDVAQSAPVAIVSEEAARRFWPGEDPLGRQIRLLFSPDITIVGVIGDVRHHALNAPVVPHIYLPHNQEPWGSLSVVIRTAGSALPLASSVRETVRDMDPRLPTPIREMDDVLSASIGRPRLYTVVIGLFGAIALALSALGIFAVVSYSASRRTREIGVRLALGARRRELVRMVVRQGMRPILAGIAIGIAGALALTRFMSTLLFGVEPADPLTFASVVIVLWFVALVACLIPAYRAARLDPVTALRAE